MDPKNAFLTLLIAVLVFGCATSRTTTTDRTAIEQALLSQSGEVTIAQLDVEGLAGRHFAIDAERIQAVDEDHLISVLERRLLELGMIPVDDTASAEVIVHASVANAGVDDSGWYIGIPEIPLGLPGVGSLTLPEMILIGRETQRGRNRMQFYGLDAESQAPRFISDFLAAERHYYRWRFLFIFAFRQTNLEGEF